MLRTPLCDLLGIEFPIIQGAMAHISNGTFAGIVSEAGGLGIITLGSADVAYTLEQIALARTITKKPFGVNIVLDNPLSPELARVVAQEKVAVVTTGAGNPEPFMSVLLGAGCKVIPVIPHAHAAIKMEKAGATAVIAEGQESGGHIGTVSTMPLVPSVCDSVKIPVIAAGGIADGRGFMAAIMLGAIGVQLGTAFLVAKECPVSQLYKDKVLAASDRDSVITGFRTPDQVRNIKSAFTDKYYALLENNAPQEEMKRLTIGALKRAVAGDEMGSFLSGQSQGLIRSEKTARQIMQDIMTQAQTLYDQKHLFLKKRPQS